MTGWGVREPEREKERRLALLLADGTGDFDFVRAVAIQNWVVLEGKVKTSRDKERAEEIARYVGFDAVVNSIRVSM
jgi:osmotically-inducible protein OsmY